MNIIDALVVCMFLVMAVLGIALAVQRWRESKRRNRYTRIEPDSRQWSAQYMDSLRRERFW